MRDATNGICMRVIYLRLHAQSCHLNTLHIPSRSHDPPHAAYRIPDVLLTSGLPGTCITITYCSLQPYLTF